MGISEKDDVFRYDDRDDFYRGALRIVVDRVRSAMSDRGRCSLALSGGRTPKPLFELMAAESAIAWQNVDVFWVDERCVSSDHQDSNFGMVQDAFLSKISIPEKNVHSVVTEGYSPWESADAYEFQLRRFFGDALPEFDVVILGVGSDGHTASLFPGDASLREKDRWAVAVDGSQGVPAVSRVTLTLPIINNSRCCIFLVTGKERATVVDEILNDRSEAAKKYPAALVVPNGELIWNIS